MCQRPCPRSRQSLQKIFKLRALVGNRVVARNLEAQARSEPDPGDDAT